jgi:predicted small lipoprotein YifL
MKKFFAALLTLAALAVLTACPNSPEEKKHESEASVKVIPCNVPSQKGCK